jgi:hypothetical protein
MAVPHDGARRAPDKSFPVDLSELLAFDSCALRIAPRRDIKAIEIWISDGGARPVVVVLGTRQALAAAALLLCAVSAVDPEG